MLTRRSNVAPTTSTTAFEDFLYVNGEMREQIYNDDVVVTNDADHDDDMCYEILTMITDAEDGDEYG